jgi:hypothetical protein
VGPATRWQVRRGGATVTAAAVALTLTGCAFGTDKIGPDETDEARLAALESAMPVDGDVDLELRDLRGSSVAYVAERPSARVELPWDDLTDEQVDLDDPLADDPPPIFDAGVALRDRLVDAGVTLVTVTCEVDARQGHVTAVKLAGTLPVDVFTAAVSAGVVERGGGVTLHAPFHTEPTDPWELEPLTGETCLDSTAPPASTTTTGPDLGPDPFGSIPGS